MEINKKPISVSKICKYYNNILLPHQQLLFDELVEKLKPYQKKKKIIISLNCEQNKINNILYVLDKIF